MDYLFLILGLLLLVAGGDAVVRGAVALARHIGMSPLLIGLTLVGFGTSLPELVTSVDAAILGSPGISIGNVIGSNIANILLILGIAALVFPITITPAAFKRDGGFVFFAALVCVVIVAMGQVDRESGLLLLMLLATYIVYTYFNERNSSNGIVFSGDSEVQTFVSTPHTLTIAVGLVVIGFAITLLGSHLLVKSSIAVANEFGISEAVIGLTIVAVGTSLPELVVSVVAAARRQSDVAFGNILGSNIFNVFGILGATGVIHPIVVPHKILQFDLWVMLGATFLLLVFAVTDWNITRREGLAFLFVYFLYLVFQGW